MPELPEVESVVNWLRPLVKNRRITELKVDPSYPNVIATSTPSKLSEIIVGKKIVDVKRRAKLIIIELDTGYLTLHLRMTGQLLNSVENQDDKHIRFTVTFSDKSTIYYRDVRKFGRFSYLPSLKPIEEKYGPEPLSESFSADWLYQSLRRKKRALKPLLLDQSFIAGLGNIYVDEALWFAKLHPLSISSSTSRTKSNALHKGIQSILAESIRNNGTTFSTFFYGENASGEFISSLNVFGREGESCKRCGKEIQKLRVAQRGTHICTNCQRKVTAL